ncbi:MAG: RNA polymerase sigma factor [Bryobacteraceae bacterium]
MPPPSGIPIAGERDSTSDDGFGEYRRLVAALASRAMRLGSRDPEGAAQEALRRSIDNRTSQAAVKYYFGETASTGGEPEWGLDQLLAWLHGVLQFVVREEQSRMAFRREVSVRSISDPADSAPDALEMMVERETAAILDECFARLDREYRQVLKLRMGGLKYSEIARRLGVNENTVATRVSRGIRELGRRIRKRMGGAHE